MDRQQAVMLAIGCELLGLAMMIFLNRIPGNAFIQLLITIVGFMLLVVGPFLLFFNREK